MQAAVTTRTVRAASRARASLIVGLLAVPLFFTIVAGLLAVILAVLGLGLQTGQHPPKAAIAGLVLGLISLTLAGWLYLFHF
jgi:CBS-domain-containing membrane protein